MTHFPEGPADLSNNPIQQYLFYRDFLKAPLDKVTGWVEAYGDTFHFQVGDAHQYMTANPDMIREITVKQSNIFIKGFDYTDEKFGMARFMGQGLVTSNGEFWKRQRKLVAPAFHTQRISAYADTMVDYAQQVMTDWQNDSQVDVDEQMMQLTLLIVARTLFDADASDTVESVKHAVEVVQEAQNTATILPSWIPTPLSMRSNRANATLNEIVYGFINERRATGEDKGDLLSMLLLSEDEDGNRMTDKEARDEAVTLFLAGHETTANTLNWTWWLLAQYPEVEAKLHQELDTVLAGTAPTLEDLRRLPYTDMVIKESMRLMPPVWSIGRTASEDTEVMGYSFPKGANVNILIYNVHRHPDIWENPNDFIPERWEGDKAKDIPKYAYMPFGGGPRICIGNSFATMEANLLLATIAQQYKLRLVDGAKIVPQPMITMFPKYGLPVTVHKRQPKPVIEQHLELELA